MTRVRLILAMLLATLFIGQSSCNRYAWEIFSDVVTVAAVVAVVAMHDAHRHHHHCGHRWVVRDGRHVYHYQDRWEYYDPHTDQWYVYEDMY